MRQALSYLGRLRAPRDAALGTSYQWYELRTSPLVNDVDYKGLSSISSLMSVNTNRGIPKHLRLIDDRPAARGTGISVPVYQRTSRFVWANIVKPEVFGTYQKIPGTGDERAFAISMVNRYTHRPYMNAEVLEYLQLRYIKNVSK